MKRVLNYELSAAETTLDLTRDAQPVKVGEQNGRLMMWVLMGCNEPRTQRTFVIKTTGEEVQDGLSYVDTIFDGSFVWHVFEKRRE